MFYKQLTSLDDLARLLILDFKLGKITRKFEKYEYYQFSIKEVKKKLKLINFDAETSVVSNELYDIAKENLLLYFHSFNEKDLLQEHFSLYLRCVNNQETISIQEMEKTFPRDKGFSLEVIAIKDLEKGTVIPYLSGKTAKISIEQEGILIKKGLDYSITTINGSKTPYLLLGPIFFINHDCKPNSKYVMRGDLVVIQTTKFIKVGQQITVYYRNNYFGHNNEECLCDSTLVSIQNIKIFYSC